MKKRWLNMALVSVVAMALLAGCGGQTGTETSGASGNEAVSEGGSDTSAPEGNVIKYVMAGEPETLDPNMNNYAASSNVLLNLFKSDRSHVVL